MTPIVALVVYLAAAFLPGDAPRYGVFATKEECVIAVEKVRAADVFVSDCVEVTVPAPRNASR